MATAISRVLLLVGLEHKQIHFALTLRSACSSLQEIESSHSFQTGPHPEEAKSFTIGSRIF